MRNMEVPKLWDLLNRFKEVCRQRGWKISDYEHIVKIDKEYHNFIGARTTHASTFRKVTSNKKRAVADGRSYHVIDVSYTAWVFQQKPSQQLIEILTADTELSKNTAVYDLSKVYQGQPLCLKLNQTDSPAFDEFEKYLKEMYGVETRPLYEPRTSEPKTFRAKLEKASVG